MNKYKNHTCLIVDNFSTTRRIIKNILIDLGFTCLEAENGVEALAIIQQLTLNLVIADTNMPEKNGMELLEDIRADNNLKYLPVVLTMIEPLEELISKGEEMGMNDYIVKPFDVFSLSKLLDKVIEMEGGEVL